jgi:hypothetical protein
MKMTFVEYLDDGYMYIDAPCFSYANDYCV